MSVLLGVILLFAVLTLVLAVMQAVRIVRVAPASANLAGFMPLGWFKFRQLEQKPAPPLPSRPTSTSAPSSPSSSSCCSGWCSAAGP